MNHTDFNRQTRVVWRQSDSQCTDSTDHLQIDNSNIIPFPARPAPVEQPATRETAAHFIILSIRQALRRTRERVLNHVRMTSKAANVQGNGERSRSASVCERATG